MNREAAPGPKGPYRDADIVVPRPPRAWPRRLLAAVAVLVASTICLPCCTIFFDMAAHEDGIGVGFEPNRGPVLDGSMLAAVILPLLLVLVWRWLSRRQRALVGIALLCSMPIGFVASKTLLHHHWQTACAGGYADACYALGSDANAERACAMGSGFACYYLMRRDRDRYRPAACAAWTRFCAAPDDAGPAGMEGSRSVLCRDGASPEWHCGRRE